jgi:hypothetical protein
MYKDDNNDNLVHGSMSAISWVSEPPEGATLERQKEAIRQGLLYRYVGKTPVSC